MILYNEFIQFFHEKTSNIHFYNVQENTNQNMQFISFIILISQEITYTLRNFLYLQTNYQYFLQYNGIYEVSCY